MTIKITIKQMRKEKNISLEKLEEETGIDRERLSNLENNKISADKISLAEMIVISESFACRISELYELGRLEIEGGRGVLGNKIKKAKFTIKYCFIKLFGLFVIRKPIFII